MSFGPNTTTFSENLHTATIHKRSWRFATLLSPNGLQGVYSLIPKFLHLFRGSYIRCGLGFESEMFLLAIGDSSSFAYLRTRLMIWERA